MLKFFLLSALCFLLSASPHAQNIISFSSTAGAFAIVAEDRTAAIVVDANDELLVQKAALLLTEDIEKVTGKKPALLNTLPLSGNCIIVGSLAKSGIIKTL